MAKVTDINPHMPDVREWQADPAGKARKMAKHFRE
jgi:hypothetical protein